MLECYLEQQAAIFSALTDKALKKKNIRDIVTLSDDDVKVAVEVLQMLKPLKMDATLSSTESAPSASMVLPLKTKILQSMAPSEEDGTISREEKAAIKADLNPRYTDPTDLQN